MVKSLQEQLISTGLIDKNKAKKIKTEQQKNSRKNRGSTASRDAGQDFREASRARTERDRELNRQRQIQNERKAVAAQIRQIVLANRLPREEGNDAEAYHFIVRGKVKKIYVGRQTREQISAGKLAIVEMDGKYDLLPSQWVEKLRARNDGCVVVYNDPETVETPVDEAYCGYRIPDDLMW